MEIDVRKIAEQLLLELQVESDKMKLRAEGVTLLYERIRKAASGQDNQSTVEKAGQESEASKGE